MKRYDVDYDYTWDDNINDGDEFLMCQMEEGSDGPYVRYDTAAKLARACELFMEAEKLSRWLHKSKNKETDQTQMFYKKQKAVSLYKEAVNDE